jgi:hypothetical protein
MLCSRHRAPLIWGKRSKNGVSTYCTYCLDEEWEKIFGEIREAWRSKSKDEMLVEIGLFYKWMIDNRYSRSYARSKTHEIKFILKKLRERNMELNEENIVAIFNKKSKQVLRNYMSAYRRFVDFKKSIGG